ncbi:MAG: YcxB family protein [Brevundimonas sp.]|uniref:YcxB family protein n=1 Tax=Brevundimonas sp. TaxID=1871086 RepID=UPI0028D4390B|nr:YcxB family protein [uncultured Brevundimonas sp.]
MIVVEAVRPTAKELRPLQSGWGVLHWIACLPLYVGFVGFLVFGLVAMGPDGDAYPPGLLFVFFGGTFIAWATSFRLTAWVNARATSKAPASGTDWRWTLSQDGLTFDTPLQANRIDWRAVKAMQEERDRFVFLVLPGHNPVLPKRLLTEEQSEALRSLVDDLSQKGVLGAGVD